MKRFFEVAAVVLMFGILLSCGGAAAQQTQPQAGVGGGNQWIPIHGHSGPFDGGTLNVVGYNCTQQGGQTVALSTTTILTCNTVKWNNGNYYDGTTNYRFTPLQAGKYFVYAKMCGNLGTSFANISVWIYENGGSQAMAQLNGTFSAVQSTCVNQQTILTFNGTSDYMDCRVQVNGSGTASVTGECGAFRIGN